MSADIVERARKFHREIVASDGSESGQMRLTRELIETVETLRAALAEAERTLSLRAAPCHIDGCQYSRLAEAERERDEALALTEGAASLKDMAAGYIEGAYWKNEVAALRRVVEAVAKITLADDFLKDAADFPPDDWANDFVNGRLTNGHIRQARALVALPEETKP